MSVLEVRGLRKNFGSSEVLRGIDFSLERGQVLAIIGSSGSGKTTLLRCLNFLELPTEGKILVDGNALYDSEEKRTLRAAEIRERSLNFGLVFQSFNLFPQYNAKENITLAPRLRKKENGGKNERSVQEIDAEADRLLARVGLSDRWNYYPCQLSGGQQQRVAIARALAMSPKILCFDEPTSALDPELTGEVLRVIRGLKSAENTMIVVTHEMEFARSVADHVLFMADGVVEEEGSPEELFGAPRSAKLRAFLANSL